MGKRGPKPTPTATLAARGSWLAKTRDGEPAPDGLLEAPEPPASLKGEARRLWLASAPGMVGIGTLTADDLPAFERYCRAHALWMRKVDEVEAAEEITESMTKALVNLDNQLRRLEAAFGKNPADRAGIKVPERSKPIGAAAKPKLRAS